MTTFINTGSVAGTTPLTVNFANPSTDPGATVSWDFGDGNTSTEPNPTHVYDTEGVFDVSVTIAQTDVRKGFVTARKGNVTVPEANFTISVASGPVPLPVTFTDTSTGTVTSLLWDFGNGISNVGPNKSISHTYTKAGVYTVSLTVTNSAGSHTATKVGAVTVTSVNGGRKPILAEEFTEGTLAGLISRGWYDGTGGAEPFHFEKDETLGRQVLYSTQSNVDMMGSGMRHALAPAGNEITVWVAVKYHNLLNIRGNCHHFHIGQGFSRTQPPAGPQCLYIEPKRNPGDERAPNGTWGAPTKTFGFDFYSANNQEYSVYNTARNNVIEDDRWYEVRTYIRTGVNGHVRQDIRPYGGTWTTISDVDINMGSRPAINQIIIGPYIHNGWTTDQRMYVGFLRVYDGNAIADGTIK